MINAGTVQVRLMADVKPFIAGMRKAQGSLAQTTKSMDAMSTAAIMSFGAIIAASGKMATSLDRRLREISTLLLDVTEDDISKMSHEIRNLASVTGKAFDDIGKAKYDIISAGFTDAAESAQLLNTSTRLAVGGVTSVKNAADLLTSSLNSWQKSGLEAEKDADILFTTVRLGKTTMDELVGSVGRVFPTAKTLGASLADVGAAMATITAGGIKTYEAATYLNQAFTKLGAPSDNAAKMMDLYGISVKKTENGMLDMLGTIKQFQGYNLEQMRQFFPEIRAIKAVLAMSNNLDFLERALNQTNNSAGATAKAFLKMSNAWSTKLSKSVMKMLNVFVEIGNKVMPDVVDTFDEFVSGITGSSDKIGNSLSLIISLFGSILTVVAKNIKLITSLSIAYLGLKTAISLASKVTVIWNTIIKASKWIQAAYILSIKASTAATFGFGAALNFAKLAMIELDIAMKGNIVGLVIAGIVAAMAAFVVGVKAIIKSNRKLEENIALTKKRLASVGLSAEMVSKKAVRKNARKGTLFDPDKLIEIADALKKVNKQFRYLDNFDIDYSKFSKKYEKYDIGSKNLDSFDVGSIGGGLGLLELSKKLDNLKAYNVSLAMAGKETYDLTKDVVNAFDIDLKPIAKFANRLMLSGNTLEDFMDIPTNSLGEDMKVFLDILKSTGNEDKTLQGIIKWIDEFYKTADKSENRIKDLYDNFNMIKDLISQGMTFDIEMIDTVFDIDTDMLEKAIVLIHKYEMNLSEVGNTLSLTEDESKALSEVFQILANSGYGIKALAEYFGLVEDKIVVIDSRISVLANKIRNLFYDLGNDISQQMSNSFTEILMAWKVASDELDKYNNGLSNSFRTVSEIQKESWSDMWASILRNTIQTVMQMLIQITLLTAAIIAANVITGGAFGALITEATKLSEASNFAKFIYSLFGGDDASGATKAITSMVVNDAIITPQGQVVQTHPDDYIMAMKQPQNFGGGGKSVVNNYNTINAMDSLSFEQYLKRNPKAFSAGYKTAQGRKYL